MRVVVAWSTFAEGSQGRTGAEEARTPSRLPAPRPQPWDRHSRPLRTHLHTPSVHLLSSSVTKMVPGTMPLSGISAVFKHR